MACSSANKPRNVLAMNVASVEEEDELDGI